MVAEDVLFACWYREQIVRLIELDETLQFSGCLVGGTYPVCKQCIYH